MMLQHDKSRKNPSFLKSDVEILLNIAITVAVGSGMCCNSEKFTATLGAKADAMSLETQTVKHA